MKQPAQLMPMISVASVDQARDFYVEKLGFDHQMGMLGKDGQLDFCTVTLGGAKVMFMRPQQTVNGVEATSARRAVELYLQVENVDAFHERLKKQKVRISDPLTDQWWGDRTFTVIDPFGYQLWFYQTVADPTPPEGAKII
jgi:PhnB protein